MADFRVVSGRAWLFIALVAMAFPESCHAENAGNFLQFTPEQAFIIGAIVGLPTAILCALAEAIFPRRRMPLWLTGLAAAAAIASIAVFAIALKAATAQPRADSRLLLLFIVPPLVALALRAVVSASSHRLVGGWIIAVASLGLAASRHPGGEAAGALTGGAAICLLLWTLTISILRARRLAPPELPNADRKLAPMAALAAASDRLAGVASAVSQAVPRGKAGSWSARLKPAESGLVWWFASACVLYCGIGVAISMGKLGGGGWLYVEWQYVADLFGLRSPKESRPAHLWWLFGLPWSLFAGSAFWGLAGLLGAFDPGRLRSVRFAAVVFGGALLVWTATIIEQIADTDARERQIDQIHR